MRVDFEREQFKSDDEQKMIRLMRGARAVAASLVIAGIGAAALSTTEPSSTERGIGVGTDGEYAIGNPTPSIDEPRAPVG